MFVREQERVLCLLQFEAAEINKLPGWQRRLRILLKDKAGIDPYRTCDEAHEN